MALDSAILDGAASTGQSAKRDISNIDLATAQLVGTFTGVSADVQRSNDGVNWVKIGISLTTLGQIIKLSDDLPARFIRVDLTAIASGAATVIMAGSTHNF